MKSILLLAVAAFAGLLVWKSTRPAVLPANAPTIKPPLKPNAPSATFLQSFPALDTFWNQATQALGVAPGTTYDPDFVRDSYDMEPVDFESAGIY